MPGLNQLKQFSEDIRNLGDEVKIRAQRGEKTVSIPLPQGISEKDDSNDFIIGLPEANKADGEASSQPESLEEVEEILSADDIENADLSSFLEPEVAADDDALADFLNDADSPSEASVEEPQSEKASETPLEDLDLDDLLKPNGDSSEPIPETHGSDADLTAALSNLGDLTDLGRMSPDEVEAPVEGSDSSSDSDLDLASFDIDSLLTGSPSSENSDSQAISSDESAAIPESDFSSDLSMPDFGSELSDSPFNENPETAPDDSEAGIEENPSEEPDFNDGVSESASQDDFSSDLSLPDFGEVLSDSAFGENPETDALGSDAGNEENESPLPEENIPEESVSSETISADSGSSFTDDSSEPDSETSAPMDSDSSLPDFGDLGDFGSMDSFAENPASGDEKPLPSMDLSSFDVDSLVSGGNSEENSDFAPSVPDASESVPGEESMETFDTSGMDGVDFAPKDSSGDEFPATDDALGGGDDFILDSNFEIPGFSDTETADMGKKKPLLDTVDFSKGKEDRPRNSLTDAEYVQFKKNLANYPLNLRIALEDFIARDEFTDDVVFEIIEKVLKKTSARQLATQLEKILDISINIPRDFERRSFAEYEAYKQSFQYQLKNRIIPAAIVGVILAFVCYGLWNAGVQFIYNPVMASIHYKQGYTLLEANEFPQSEQEFQEAVGYKPVKKWFFRYARGYRTKRQYERAAKMYRNILRFFDHDKQAGLDYAEMELYDRANYERAEEIVRREVLDYHINDADGLLMLGDVFLEWAELDPSKYDSAKEQYLDLIQRYGGNNVYLSRMLRYNIRTDKLRDVLTYKNMLYQGKNDKKNLKNLGASDWTELSGYMLEKLYGPLSKNDEYLRSSIEDVLAMLNLAIKADPSNPVARYNLARYFIQNGNTEQAKIELERSLDLFSNVAVRTKKNVYREINTTRILGELYAGNKEYLKAQSVYTRGISLYNEEHENATLEGDCNTGKLFADMGDLDYFISGDMDDALYNYEKAIEIKNDTPSINFRVGVIYYGKQNYDNALASFIKVAEKEPKEPNVLLSLGNVLALRGDNFTASSYYSHLIDVLDSGREKEKFLLPQEDSDDYAIVDLYLKANNNLGVTLYRLAQQTGNSNMNAESVVRLSDSIRAYDALTRNPKTMVRMEGSNLAAQNSKYITHPHPDFEPAIYTDIPKILSDEKGLD